jgi:hypothetical protein
VRKTKAENSSENNRRMRPALTPEARENQLISLAVDLAEKQLMEGTASSQVITHYLKLGSTRERKELEILEKQKDLMDAKTKAIQSAQSMEKLYANALDAMKNYSGRGDSEDD